LAYIDTGCDGDLCIPESAVEQLGLPVHVAPYRLAVAQRIWAPEYRGTLGILGWDLRLPAVIVALGSEVLQGRRVVDRFRVTFDGGQRVLLET
jgi:predicted aspartyl protease